MFPLINLLILTFGVSTHAFKILVLYPAPSFSHQRSIMALTERLVKDGHELFVVSPNVVPGLEQHENYTHVDVSFAYEYATNPKKEGAVNLQKQMSKWEIAKTVIPTGNIIRKQFESEAVLQFVRRVELEKIKFDVAITENWVMSFTRGLTHLMSGPIPIISMSPAATDDFAEESLGSITHLSFRPSMFNHYTDRMDLWQRLENWSSHLYLMQAFKSGLESVARSYFRENFGPEKEGLVDGCWSNASLSIVASNSLYFYPRLLGPNVVEVGPLHLKSPEKLPKILQDWLDGAAKGVIYFSLGSNMKSKSLPEDVRANFLKIFKELPLGYRVLWKWELDGEIPGQSNNILAQTWVPQESVLAHKKVKVFITQGGLQSFQEAVHYGKPTVGIPWFGDQESSVSKMVDAGIGVRLLPPELYSSEKIKAALEKMLNDESYSKNMKRLSAISHDLTSQAMDKAVFWVEHVARHGGASHLRPATADTTLFEYFCLDIIAVILLLISTILFVTLYVANYFISMIFWRSSVPKIKTS